MIRHGCFSSFEISKPLSRAATNSFTLRAWPVARRPRSNFSEVYGTAETAPPPSKYSSTPDLFIHEGVVPRRLDYSRKAHAISHLQKVGVQVESCFDCGDHMWLTVGNNELFAHVLSDARARPAEWLVCAMNEEIRRAAVRAVSAVPRTSEKFERDGGHNTTAYATKGQG